MVVKKTIIMVVLAAIVLGCGASLAYADAPFFGCETLQFQPDPVYLDNFSERKVYTWGIDHSLAANEFINFAQISFTQINNYMADENILYVNLINSAVSGLASERDTGGDGNWFGSKPETQLLFAYKDTDCYNAENFTYTFKPEQLTALNKAFADGNIGLGFDPDANYYSHFTNDGVTLRIQTRVVPEPISCVLFVVGSGIFGIAARKRHRGQVPILTSVDK
jgi:hypothetical protein